MKDYTVTFYLDTRREKDNRKYPLKLRVYSSASAKAKLYPTNFDLTEKEFDGAWKTEKTRSDYKGLKLKLQALEIEINKICDKIEPFNFEQLEKVLFRKKGDEQNIIYCYNQAIAKLTEGNHLGTASNYNLALKSLINFAEHIKGKTTNKILFSEITPHWLNSFESYMINDLERSPTTVSIYLRTLRTIFNTAIRDKDIEADSYPFGRGKYQPHSVRNVKKALNKNDLKTLLEASPDTPEQRKARDFWFFSYICNGMNIKDIALLKFENLKTDTIEFYRAKTINTAKTDLHPIIVYLNDFTREIISTYGNEKVSNDTYLFPILLPEDSEITKFNKIKNFTRFINQNLKKLAEKEGITTDISTYWARHSFATHAIRQGASKAFVGEALNHRDSKTTELYFAGFAEEDKKEFTNKLMDFD